MDARRHADLARVLIRLCGGLEAAASLCRLEKSRLSDCQIPGRGFMPADVILDLEAHCARPIYSAAMQGAHQPPPAADLAGESCNTAEHASALQRLVRQAMDDGRLDEAERRAIAHELAGFEHQVRRLRAAHDGGEGQVVRLDTGWLDRAPGGLAHDLAAFGGMP